MKAPIRRRPSFTRVLTTVRNRLVAKPELFNGRWAFLRDHGCGCLYAHVADVLGTRQSEDVERAFPLHYDWLHRMLFASVDNKDDPDWAISTLNVKLASLKRATARKARQ